MAGNFYYVKMCVRGDAEKLTQFKRECITDNKLDFNAICPMPSELDFVMNSSVETGFNALYGDWQDVACQWMLKPAAAERGYAFPLESRQEVINCLSSLDCADQYLVPGQRFRENLEKFGHGSRESWREEHWGCWWNAGGVKMLIRSTSLLIWFSVDKYPAKLMKAMSKRFPDLRFELTYTDDFRRYGRRLVLENGREVEKETVPKEERPRLIREYETLSADTWAR